MRSRAAGQFLCVGLMGIVLSGARGCAMSAGGKSSAIERRQAHGRVCGRPAPAARRIPYRDAPPPSCLGVGNDRPGLEWSSPALLSPVPARRRDNDQGEDQQECRCHHQSRPAQRHGHTMGEQGAAAQAACTQLRNGNEHCKAERVAHLVRRRADGHRRWAPAGASPASGRRPRAGGPHRLLLDCWAAVSSNA